MTNVPGWGPPQWQQQPQQPPWPQQQWQQPAPPAHLTVKTHLSAGEHWVHGILTLCTGGLWGIVWIIAASRGHRTKVTTWNR